MTYNFDKKTNRKDNNSAKWDEIKRNEPDEDLLPMWIADMDFETAPEILEALQMKLDQKIFGYTSRSDKYYKSVGIISNTESEEQQEKLNILSISN